jgi:hypothetical protein
VKIKKIAGRLEILFWTVVIILMKDWKKKLALPLLTLGGVCFLAGMLAVGLSVAHSKDTRSDNQATSGLPANVSDLGLDLQRNTLVLLADQLGNAMPRLKGVWLTVYVPALGRVIWLPVYPASLTGGEDEDHSLASLFKLDVNGAPDALFMEALLAKDLDWDQFILLDDDALGQLIELVGGVDLGQGLTDGARVIAILPAAWDYPQSALIGQSILIRQLCRKAPELLTNEPSKITRSLSEHIFTDMQLKSIESEWRRLQAVQGILSCEFPTLPGQLTSQARP